MQPFLLNCLLCRYGCMVGMHSLGLSQLVASTAHFVLASPHPLAGQPGVTTEVASCTTGVALSVDTARWGAATALPDAARLIRIGCGVPQACAPPPLPPSP